MSRIDAAWKRASGKLVDDAPAPASPLPRVGPTTDTSLAGYGAEETQNGSPSVPARVDRLPIVRAALSSRVVPAQTPSSLRGKLVGTPEMEALSVEQYKRLATALQELQVQRGTRSLMISSALPREGKTLTVANLALTLGSFYGRQVLVIDADLLRPSIHEVFGIANERGLLDALRSGDTPLPVLQVTPGVSVVTSGRAPEPSTWVLSSDRLRFLVAEAAGQYDWILIDTPPAATLTDAQFIARATDGILLVVAAGVTPYTLVQRTLTDLGVDRVVGTVLNRVAERLLPVGTYYHQHYSDPR
jgi:capsular exopolysaccharide synthesis family protein